jgi:hypothetical protein
VAYVLLSSLRPVGLGRFAHARPSSSASISSLTPSVSCRRCSPNAPFARLETLTVERPQCYPASAEPTAVKSEIKGVTLAIKKEKPP